VAIRGEAFYLNGRPTYAGRYYQGHRIEGLLLVSRMINGIFDDENPYTRVLWTYPDTGMWDPLRNTQELVAHMPVYQSFGLNTLTIGLQGGSPLAYSAPRPAVMALLNQRGVTAPEEAVYEGTIESDRAQPWRTTAFRRDGSLKPAFLKRLTMIVKQADALGMIILLVVFYFGQDERLTNEAAVKRAVTNTCQWVLAKGFTNVLLEINNECNVPRYEHEILQPHRVHELIELAKTVTYKGRRLLVGTSYAAGSDRPRMPGDRVVAASDMVLLHGNGLDVHGVVEWVKHVRGRSSYRPMPILYDEDDHYLFAAPVNHFQAAISAYSGWGYFDNGGETTPHTHRQPAVGNYRDGYQNIPVNWGVSTPRKQAFFKLVQEVSGAGTH
jgi:hypothetical protein